MTFRVLATMVAAWITIQSAFAADITGGAGAKIVKPLQLLKVEDLYFGSIVPSTTVDSQVQITHKGVKVCPAELTCLTNDHTNATFIVSGQDQASYTVTVSNSIQLTTQTGASMVVDNFDLSKTSGVLSGGKDIFTVGGTLNVSAQQDAGDYTGAFSVTVEYQ